MSGKCKLIDTKTLTNVYKFISYITEKDKNSDFKIYFKENDKLLVEEDIVNDYYRSNISIIFSTEGIDSYTHVILPHNEEVNNLSIKCVKPITDEMVYELRKHLFEIINKNNFD